MFEFICFSIFIIGLCTIGVWISKLIIFILSKFGIQINKGKKEI